MSEQPPQPQPTSRGVQPQVTPFTWAFGRLNEQPHVKVIHLQTVIGPLTLFCTAEDLARFADDAAREVKGSRLVVARGPLPVPPGGNGAR